MSELEHWLDQYNSIVDTYESLQWNEIEGLNTCLKDLSVVLSHLEHLRQGYQKKWIGVSMQSAGVAAGEREANNKVPELYHLRRIMTAGYRILDAIRSNISSANKEKS